MTAPPLVVRVRRVAGAPVVAVRVWVRGGNRSETVPGEAYVAGRLLAEGSRKRDWRRVAEDAESLGMALNAFGAGDVHGLAVDALAGDWEQALAWAAELVAEPAFATDRVRWMRRHTAGELESLADQPDVVAGWAFLEHLYGDHPRGRPIQGDSASLRRLGPRRCAAFHRAGLAQGLVVTVAGEIDEERVAARVESLFGAVATAARAGAPPTPAPPVPSPPPELRRELPCGGSDQAHLYAGHLTVHRSHPDFIPLQVLAVILGAGPGLGGRFPTRIRERDGLAYAASVQTTAGTGLDPGRFVVYVGTSPGYVPRAEAGIREELDRLLADGATAVELEDARAYLLGREPFRRETARQWAELLAEATFYGVPSDDAAALAAKLNAIDSERLMEVARRHLRPAELRVTVGLPKPRRRRRKTLPSS